MFQCLVSDLGADSPGNAIRISFTCGEESVASGEKHSGELHRCPNIANTSAQTTDPVGLA
jgi:hypothetical protein